MPSIYKWVLFTNRLLLPYVVRRNHSYQEDLMRFAHLLRYSKLMQLGNVKGRRVLGEIVNVVGQDLYVDYGGKFMCICKPPHPLESDGIQITPNELGYEVGSKVIVKLDDMELSARFLGSEKAITLLECDGYVKGLHKPASSRIHKTENVINQSEIKYNNHENP
ncbi:hypothetical protein GJ496_008785 [Pomphorhynchus laevis]|nr:hypothetical protein GJ496_008785 [Pomphorhynchus laevis]